MSDQNTPIEKEEPSPAANETPEVKVDKPSGEVGESQNAEKGNNDSKRDGLLINGMIAATILCLVISVGAAGYQIVSCWKSCKEVPLSEPAQALWSGIVSEKTENRGLGTTDRLAVITKFKAKEPGATEGSSKKE